MLEIRPVDWSSDTDAFRQLMREYAATLAIDWSYQCLDDELAQLPGRYAPPDGNGWLAWDGTSVAGCVAMRSVDARTVEMKRLYVRPAFRAQGLGRALAKVMRAAARVSGRERVVLDTLPSMHSALQLSRSLGFREIAPYGSRPLADTIYLGLEWP